jgi:thiol-disulfide isomerase/thioredoxin
MKKIIFALACFLFAGTSNAQNNYTILGKISGKADGMKVYLKTREYPDPKINDSTVIKNGQFTFKGHVDVPVMAQIVIDRTPKGKVSDERNWTMSRFYLENSNINYSGDIQTLPHYYWSRDTTVKQPTITGSATQNEYVKYNDGIADLRKQLGKTDEEYLKVYHIPAGEGIFHTKEGITLARKYNALSKEAEEIEMNYINQHPNSVVAYDLAMQNFYSMNSSLTVKQIDDLVGVIKKGWAGTPNMAEFEKAAASAKKTAIGEKYQDFQMSTVDGKKVMLSKYVPEGKIVMLEFWASWCGPCRGEIPHLKHLNETKSDVFNIVSISLDEKDADWHKAMKEEGMVWTQLCDPHGFEGEIAKAYNITGIPMSLILDREGRIMKIGLRGAFLDAYLEDLPNAE